MPAYTTQTRIEKLIGRSLTADELANLTEIIASVSAALAAYLDRNYLDVGQSDPNAVAETTRLYGVEASGSKELFIDDFYSISDLSFLDYMGDVSQTLDTDFYYFSPYNNPTIKNSLLLRSYYFPCGAQTVSVTGKFTSGVVPAEVVSAATKLVAQYFADAGNLDGFESESIEGYSYKVKSGMDADEAMQNAMASIEHLRRITL